jgi:serine-type anaerobic sulfatase-maturating enzyme
VDEALGPDDPALITAPFDAAAVERLGERLVDLHAALPPEEQRALEHLVWRALEPLDRYGLAEDRILSDDERELVADLDAAAPDAGSDVDPDAGPVTIVVKGTRHCNLRCTYCHDWRTGPDATMSFPTLAALVAGALRDPAHSSVDFIWHGGETTLLPIEWYERALVLQARFRRPNQVVRNSLQTNATRLTRRWAAFLRDNQFGVGVSLDGPAEIHDQTRIDTAGRPTYQRVREGMALLERFGVEYGVLTVADREVIDRGARALLQFIVDAGVSSFGVLPAEPPNLPDAVCCTVVSHYADPVTMGRFMCELYDLLAEHTDGPHCRELDAIEKRLAADDAGFCKLGGDCLGQFYMVEPTGEISHCDLFQGDARYDFGHVGPRAFLDVRRTLALAERRRARAAEVDAMRGCPHFEVCQGWCPHETYLSVRHNPAHDSSCCGLAPVIEHIGRRLEQGAPTAVTVG